MITDYLASRQAAAAALAEKLNEKYAYASVLGKQITGKRLMVSTSTTAVRDTGEQQCGFVVKLYNEGCYSEYSFSDLTEDAIPGILTACERELKLSEAQKNASVHAAMMKDEPLVKDFSRPMNGRRYSVQEALAEMTAIRDKISAASEKIVQASVSMELYEVSAIFFSRNRKLSQSYGWAGLSCSAMAREGRKMQRAGGHACTNSTEESFRLLSVKAEETAKLAVELLSAEQVVPGVYDIITAPSITGLIAHEAFGHGVEMDMFVKHRAKSMNYLGKPVASPLVNMHDGAAARVPAEPASDNYEQAKENADFMHDPCIGYFFDDDGVLAHDTLIIENGILRTGISDAVSAAQLGTEPTGNGRRQDPSHKAYTRMTNTFFAPGTDKLEDMIASIDYGYMLFDTSNGMEDPKNWNIQCVAQYGREIKDGKFTGKLIAPVVMSGYVPELLMSVSMVSDEWQIIGAGHCGKGYKEWVPVSDGGPYLKAKCKLG